MNLTQRVAKLEKQLEKERALTSRLKSEQTKAFTFMAKYPESAWYIEFLKDEVYRLEIAFDQLSNDFALLLADNTKKTKALESFNVVSPQESI